HNLVKFIQYTTVNGATPYYNANDTITFSFVANSNLPVSYQDRWFGSHQLSYDASNRISKDSVLNEVGRYAYSNNTINYTITGVVGTTNSFPGSPIYGPVFIDTITLANENIEGLKENVRSSLSFSQFSYPTTAYENPAYHAASAGTTGPLLFHIISLNQTETNTNSLDYLYVDFISKDLANSIVTDLTGNTFNYSYSLDAQGRIGAGIFKVNGNTTATLAYSYY
ncbi:MAG TPA: hypothetical protein VK559_07865, partial [Ferruginibacter sp.]|nr:hypothetical protein [Ferruginibacter sp.]